MIYGKNIKRNRFDDWQLLLDLSENFDNCLIDLNNNLIIDCFKNKFKKKYDKTNIATFLDEDIEYDKIIITEFYEYKKLPTEIHFSIIQHLKHDGEIILFKRNFIPFINFHFYYKNLFPNMYINSEYSILPFYNENPLFFLPIHESAYIKYSLNIIISTVQTISPEVKSKFGYYYNIGLFLLKKIRNLKLYNMLSFFCLGNIIIFHFDE